MTDTFGGNMKKYAAVICASLGITLVLGGVGLGIFSRIFASTIELDPYFPRTIIDRGGRDIEGTDRAELAGVPEYFGASAMVLGTAVLVAALAIYLWRKSEDAPTVRRRAAAAAFVAAAWIAWSAVSRHLFVAFEYSRGQYAYFERFPTAIGASGLILVGAVLVAASAFWGQPRTVHRTLVIVPCVLGLVMSAGVSTVAVGMGDNSTRAGHTLAVSSDIPEMPSTLGSQAYEIALPAVGDGAILDLVIAGAGFVMATPRGITAYDGQTGKERWHYLVPEPIDPKQSDLDYESGTLAAYDHGRVVVGKWHEMIGFDALTGEILWSGSEIDADKGERSQEWWGIHRVISSDVQFTVDDDGRMARYDPRTGHRLWTWDTATSPLCESDDHVVAIDSMIVTTQVCFDGTDEIATVTAHDPASGAIVASRELMRRPRAQNPDTLRSRLNMDRDTVWVELHRSSQVEIVGSLLIRSPQDLQSAALLDGIDILDISDDGSTLIVRGNGADSRQLLFMVPKDAPAERIQVADSPHIGNPLWEFLADDLTSITEQTGPKGIPHYSIRSFDSTDGSLSTTLTLESKLLQSHCRGGARMRPAPGALLVYCIPPKGATDANGDGALVAIR